VPDHAEVGLGRVALVEHTSELQGGHRDEPPVGMAGRDRELSGQPPVELHRTGDPQGLLAGEVQEAVPGGQPGGEAGRVVLEPDLLTADDLAVDDLETAVGCVVQPVGRRRRGAERPGDEVAGDEGGATLGQAARGDGAGDHRWQGALLEPGTDRTRRR
jgi:hypothetical protein